MVDNVSDDDDDDVYDDDDDDVHMMAFQMLDVHLCNIRKLKKDVMVVDLEIQYVALVLVIQ